MKRFFSNRGRRWTIIIAAGILVISGLTVGGLAVFGNRNKQADAACPVIIPTYTARPGQVAIGESDNGSIVEIKTGDQLIVVVKYFPSTGYGWSLKEISNPEVLTKVQSIYNPGDA
jgi:hypothetical protein